MPRLAIARELYHHPKTLLLDAAATERLEAVLKDRLAAGAYLLLVTHDHTQAGRLADRTVTIEDGRITSFDGPAAYRQCRHMRKEPNDVVTSLGHQA